MAKGPNLPDIPIFSGSPGIKVALPNNATAYNSVKLHSTEKFRGLSVDQTNLYTRQYLDSHNILRRFARARDWHDVTFPKTKILLGLFLQMGIL